MMNDHTLRVLEYDRLREIVARFAVSPPGRDRVLELLPATDEEIVRRRLAETKELMLLRQAGEQVPLAGIGDCREAVGKLAVSGLALRPEELLVVAAALAAGRRCKAFFRRFDGAESPLRAPLLAEIAGRITPLKEIEDAVTASIDETGEVKDSASPELRRLRKLIQRTRDDILGRMERLLRGSQNVVQEQVITIRDDRYVIPLKPNFRQSIRGVVHGQSGSRATVFVEPLDVLDQNNHLAELRMDERDEVERILRGLTSRMAAEAAAIGATVDALAGIDAVSARAEFGAAYGGATAELSHDGRLVIRAARHPLLVVKQRQGGGAVVANDLDLAADRKTLIISGPNAGGKTVVLKTIGLLCLMHQAGIPTTAAEGSALPVFSGVFADIGDDQSIEEDLSTFSSHMKRIAAVLTEADGRSLVLLDELGSGTDPAEGVALGSAVLQSLVDRGCTTVVTTHHGGLKLFGSRTEGAVNAAMEFDSDTLKPTYRFLPGRPGRSYGLDMAGRIGIPPAVVNDARGRMNSDEAGLDRLLEQVEQDARRLGLELEAAEDARREAERRRQEAETLARAAADEARTARAKARQDARDVVDALRRKLKELSRVTGMGRPEVEEERRSVASLAARLEEREAPREETAPMGKYDLRPGDRVRIPRLRKTGTVLFVSGEELEVDSGGMKLRLRMRDAVPLEQKERQAPLPSDSGWSAALTEREGIADRLNLLGKRVDEALLEVDRFIDRAAVIGLRQVTVIHGLGTGALKEAVTAFLKGHALVESIRPGEPSEGGAGVTVAELKK